MPPPLDSIIATSHAPSPLRYVKSMPISDPCEVKLSEDLSVVASEGEVPFPEGCFVWEDGPVVDVLAEVWPAAALP